MSIEHADLPIAAVQFHRESSRRSAGKAGMNLDARAPARPPFGPPQTRPKAASGARYRTARAAAVKRRVNCPRNPRNETVQIQEQAKQRVIAAQADAEAMKIKTDALEKSQSLVLCEAVQKWNGVLPTIVLAGRGQILNIPAMTQK